MQEVLNLWVIAQELLNNLKRKQGIRVIAQEILKNSSIVQEVQ